MLKKGYCAYKLFSSHKVSIEVDYFDSVEYKQMQTETKYIFIVETAILLYFIFRIFYIDGVDLYILMFHNDRVTFYNVISQLLLYLFWSIGLFWFRKPVLSETQKREFVRDCINSFHAMNNYREGYARGLSYYLQTQGYHCKLKERTL